MAQPLLIMPSCVMTVIDPLTPFTCTLVCLESFFTDVGRSETQCRILLEERDILIRALPIENGRPKVETFGAIGVPALVELAQKLRLKTTPIPITGQLAMDKEISGMAASSTIFLLGSGAWSGGNGHCVRVGGLIEPGRYEIFDPSFPKAQIRSLFYSELEPATSFLLHLENTP